jgi:hypothetical protein
MATSEILPFAQGVGANVDTQAAYLADVQRLSGQQPGIARSAFNNKALLQSTVMASALAEFIAANQANNVTDQSTIANLNTWLGDALRASLGITAPQFDNDLSLATTAFVQRAAGNLSDYMFVSSAQVLTAAAAGKVLGLSGSGYTVTMPDASTVLIGTTITIVGQANTLPIAINRAAANTFTVGSNAGVTSVTVPPGETLTLTAVSASTWLATGGSRQASFGSTFFSLLSPNGYQKLPSGLIIQWGSATSVGTSPGNCPATLPIAFPTGGLHGYAIQNGASHVVSMTSISTTTVVYDVWISTTGVRAAASPIQYIVVGY